MSNGPRSLQSLHASKGTDVRRAPRQNKQERDLDALLSANELLEGDRSEYQSRAEVSPIDALRERFLLEFVPIVEELDSRYAERGISVVIDVSDFLGGGRSIVIEITHNHNRHRVEGTVVDGAIAFTESRFLENVPGTVTSGPRLRTRELNDAIFREFVYERMIQLVKAGAESKR